ncbi:hypothetical protein BDV93DRAFT_559408, partial [Ceratobasidium sp. AG-I]
GNLFLWDDRYDDEYYETAKAQKNKSWDHRYWTLRGCLVTFCPRLDTPGFVKSEVLAAVQGLQRSPSAKSVALVYSGRQVMAVSISNGVVRHTPAVLFHNSKLAMKDGALLMMHLLNLRLGNKTFETLSQPCSADVALTSDILPAKVLRNIIHYADFNTFLQFGSVCQYTRSLCLSYPRVNNSTLMRAVNGSFLVRDVETGDESLKLLRRAGWEVHKELDSTFHIRQSGYGTDSQAKCEFTVVHRKDSYRHFTYSERSEDMVEEVNLRMIGVWGQWSLEDME